MYLSHSLRYLVRSLHQKHFAATSIYKYHTLQICSHCNNIIPTRQFNFQDVNKTALYASQRHFSLASYHNKENQEKDEETPGGEKPVSIKSRLVVVTVFAVLGGALLFYMNQKKTTEKLKKRDVEMSKVDIGAEDYELTDNTGKRVTKKNFLGKWLLLYFGFTHCPDICPEELERMSDIVDIIDNDKSVPDIQPIFISVDPERDTPEAITTYLSEFHSKFIGLTGTSEEIKRATKAFRVYYQAGPKDDDNDYIVDHTIVMYLMNPKGLFVDYYGSRSVPINKIVSGIKNNMQNYQKLHG